MQTIQFNGLFTRKPEIKKPEVAVMDDNRFRIEPKPVFGGGGDKFVKFGGCCK